MLDSRNLLSGLRRLPPTSISPYPILTYQVDIYMERSSFKFGFTITETIVYNAFHVEFLQLDITLFCLISCQKVQLEIHLTWCD